MRRKHSKLKPAIIAAFPLEAFNFWVIGYPAATHPVSHLSQIPVIALQWYVLHLPGIIAVDRSLRLRHHEALSSIVLFFAGYIGTAIFLLAILWLAELARRALRKLSSPMKQAA